MVQRLVFPSTNKKSLERARRSTLNAAAFRSGSGEAKFRLSRRYLAYLSLSVGMPWQQRLELANAARKRNQEKRKQDKEKAAALRPYMESTREQ